MVRWVGFGKPSHDSEKFSYHGAKDDVAEAVSAAAVDHSQGIVNEFLFGLQ